MFGSLTGSAAQAGAAPGATGAPASSATPAPPAAGGFSFGAAAAPNATTTATQPATSGGGFAGFGSTAAKPASTLNAANPQAPQQLGASTATAAPNASIDVTKSTRYGELPDQLRQQIDMIESFIEKQKESAEELQSNQARKEIEQVQKLCENLKLKNESLKNLLDRDVASIKNLKETMQSELKNTDNATRFIDRYKNPHQSIHTSTSSHDSSTDYFLNVTNRLENKLQVYRQTIDDLERHFQAVTQRTPNAPLAIAEILRNQHESFMSIAGKMAQVHDAISAERQRYLAFRNKYFGEGRDPFRGKHDRNTIPLDQIAADLLPSQAAAKPAAPTAFGGFGASTGGFGQPAATAGFGGFGTSTSAPKQTTGFGGFGATTTMTQPSTTGFGAFGTTSTQPTIGGFGGATTTQSGFGGFGSTPAQPAATGGFGGFGAAATPPAATGGFGGFGATTTPPAFGGGAATPASTTGGFGVSTSQPSTSGFSFGGFGKK